MVHPYYGILCLKEWDRTLWTGIEECLRFIVLRRNQISGKYIQDFSTYGKTKQKMHIIICPKYIEVSTKNLEK